MNEHQFVCQDCETTWQRVWSKDGGIEKCHTCGSRNVELQGGEVVFDARPRLVGQIIGFPCPHDFPTPAMMDVIRLYYDQAQDKHAETTWPDKGRAHHLTAAARHIRRYNAGETIDPDSGAPTLAHIALRILMALECARREKG